jgi:insulysin
MQTSIFAILRPIALFCLVILGNSSTPEFLDFGSLEALELPQKHELDERVYRRFVLDNQLKVLLVSDPKMNRSGAAMDVAVGSLSDPKEHQGLAHFLEHMLFLGTKKYPTEGEYGQFIKSRGGYLNAYTAGDHTNYHFAIHHDALEGALDRFAQFFIAPLFNPEFSSREKQAVHNEHQKNLLNDMWRNYHLMNRYYDPEHPAHHFSTGNKDTLAKVDQSVLKSFYERYYSANQMALVIASSKSLDWMEKRVREKFSAIADQKREDIRYPAEYLPQTETLRVLRVKPVKDIRQLQLNFSLPSLDAHFKSQPETLIGAILGHEGEGSLLSHLKSLGLATGLGAGAYKNTQDYASFSISVQLTPKGLQEVEKVAELCFSAVEVLKSEAFPLYMFKELKTRQQLEKVYSQRPEDAALAMELAMYLNRYPMEWTENIRYSLTEPDEKMYKELLTYLKPENCLVIISDKSLDVDLREEVYGTEYSYKEEKEWFQRLKAVKADANIKLPKPNPFLPQKAQSLAMAPTLVINREGLELYHAQDMEFRRPKASLIYRFRPNASYFDLNNTTLMDLAIQCLSEQLNENSYAASMAGVHFGLQREDEGIKLIITGYDDSLPKLLNIATSKLTALTINQERFDALKDKSLRALQNFELEDAWKHARILARNYRRLNTHLPKDKLRTLQEIQYQDIKTFIAEKLWKQHHVEAIAYGNLYATQAVHLTQSLLKNLNVKALKEKSTYRQSYLSPESPFQHRHKDTLKTNNACYRMDLVLGEDSPKNRMLGQLMSNFMSEPFYSEMRTRQQLGYIVWSGAFKNPLHHYLTFIIQSGTHTAQQVEQKVLNHLPDLVKKAKEITPEKFEVLKQAVRKKLLEKPKGIHDKASELFSLTFDENGNYDLKDELLNALDGIKMEDIANTLSQALDLKNNTSISVLLEAAPKAGEVEKGKGINEKEVSGKGVSEKEHEQKVETSPNVKTLKKGWKYRSIR